MSTLTANPHTLGTMTGEQPLTWWPPEQGHMLISGGVGRGKTIAAGLARDHFERAGWEVDYIDGKTLGSLGNESSTEEVANTIAAIRADIGARYDRLSKGAPDVHELGHPRLLIVDELDGLLVQTKQHSEETARQIQQDLGWIARTGREASVFLLVSVQRVVEDHLDQQMRANFSCVVSLGEWVDAVLARDFFRHHLASGDELRPIHLPGVGLTPESISPRTVGLASIAGQCESFTPIQVPAAMLS